ncbi:NAD-dependent succinate-semialdehyde dehydrogenase [Nocardia donostiensis]|uniref:NAD-dependent succinate-semialdehyde dehydrogenase n=1 Tax=Nocardia donostiensis TaxID=1538463 RepID=A0A1W0BA92_9NOCA|nr:NAD-dependent succinate-semialdehyde dehydrogenase [Nocardia donostiensis]ONM46705.1 NAD-dependent succinate-semialdehyde dehydrogenase [Nocardia donostiensis]OQS19328.1 NAD-dependent succinate-semialdehyde dehydrogenase [Nocardia donostiensis]
MNFLETVPTGLLIGGEWREADDASRFVVEDPATGDPLAYVADAGAAEMAAALDEAAKAQEAWAATAPRWRSELLRAAYEEVVRRAEDFALLITLEMGKPLAESRGEVRYGAEFLRWFAEEAVRIGGRWSQSPEGTTRLLTMKEPVGPTLMITPWNFPLAMATRKIAPAIAAGCTMVLKPAEQTPLTSLAFAELLRSVGLPAGVLNVVTTTRAAEAITPLLQDSRLRKLTFTGSTAVGKRLMAQASDQLLRVSMELGGNAPLLVFADANIDRAVEGAMIAKMRNVGQACTAANRLLVHESVAAEFGARFAAAMAAQRMGRGTDPDVQVGPLIDERAREKVARLVSDAAAHGAQVLTGGSVRTGAGYFFEPTVLTEVGDHAITREELFGPVAPISTFVSDDEAVAMANATEYGLASYVFSENMSRILNVVEGLQFGMVGVNQGVVSNAAAPFGGIKHSGFGREGGAEGIEEYLATKYVGIAP